MYEKWQKRLTPKCRLLVALVFLVVGIILQIISDEPLDMYAFYAMAAAMLCLVSVLIGKMVKKENNFILYVILNLAVLIFGIALTDAADYYTISDVILYSLWAILVVGDWVINAVLLPCENIAKRIVLGFVTSILNIVLIAIVFMVPILISVFF